MSGESKDQHTPTDGADLVASGPVLARWLGISGKAVYDLAKAGILVRISRDQFSLEESVRRIASISGELHRSTTATTSVLFELIAARYERRSLLITANQPFGEWGKIFSRP